MADGFTQLGVTRESGNPDRQCINILVLFVFGKDVSVFFLKSFDGIAGISNGRTVRTLNQLGSDVEIVLIIYLADDSFDEVVNGDQPSIPPNSSTTKAMCMDWRNCGRKIHHAHGGRSETTEHHA